MYTLILTSFWVLVTMAMIAAILTAIILIVGLLDFIQRLF